MMHVMAKQLRSTLLCSVIVLQACAHNPELSSQKTYEAIERNANKFKWEQVVSNAVCESGLGGSCLVDAFVAYLTIQKGIRSATIKTVLSAQETQTAFVEMEFMCSNNNYRVIEGVSLGSNTYNPKPEYISMTPTEWEKSSILNLKEGDLEADTIVHSLNSEITNGVCKLPAQ